MVLFGINVFRLAIALSLAGCYGSVQPEHSASGPAAAPARQSNPRPAVSGTPVPTGWTEQKLENGFFIALPTGYALKVSNGPDFAVYYFAPTDTTALQEFSGGVYFGNAPQDSQLGTANGCQASRQAVQLLNQPATLAVQYCPSGYAVHTLVRSPSISYEGEQLDIFGRAGTAGELRQLRAALATLRYQAPADAENQQAIFPTLKDE